MIINWEADGDRAPAWTSDVRDLARPRAARPTACSRPPTAALVPAAPLAPGTVSYTYAPEVGSQERGGYTVAEEPAA